MHAAESGFARQGPRLREVLGAFAGKPDDHVRGQGEVGRAGAQGGDQVQVAGPAVEAAHPLQHPVASRLERDVEVAAVELA